LTGKRAEATFKAVGNGLVFFAVFLGIGIWRWYATGQIFFILNFGYIGLIVLVGYTLSNILPRKKKPFGRKFTQMLIGLYLLGFVSFLGRENMQIEGFFFYLFVGVLYGPTLHYLIAKIAGPLLFGRGWCGWACWTTMVLDFLPWQRPKNGRMKYLGLLRYIHFAIAFGLVYFLYFMKEYDIPKSSSAEFYWLAIGNLLYYASSIMLAVVLEDNRAFCKYLCPIPAIMKVGSRFSLMKQEIDSELCVDCGTCEKTCPMNIKLLDYLKEKKRVLSTECVLCNTCVYVCPEEAIKTTAGFDFGLKEYVEMKEEELNRPS